MDPKSKWKTALILPVLLMLDVYVILPPMRNWIKIYLPRSPTDLLSSHSAVLLTKRSYYLSCWPRQDFQETNRPILRIKITISLTWKTRYLLSSALQGYSFSWTMTDQSITVSLYSYVLAYPVYRNTKLLLKGNLTFSLHDSQACSDNCLLIRTDHGTKEENFF